MKNGFFRTYIIFATIITSTPSFAFLKSDTENSLLKKLNQEYQVNKLTFEDFHCSRRQQACVVNFSFQDVEGQCTLEKISTSYDVIDGQGEQAQLTQTAHDDLSSCVKKFM